MKRMTVAVATCGLLLIVGTGCAKQRAQEARTRRAAQVQDAVCGSRVSDSCKVAALNGKNGPILAIKYSSATDVFTMKLARDAELANQLIDEGFVEVDVSDGLYYWKRLKLERQKPAPTTLHNNGQQHNAKDAALAARVEQMVRTNDEVQVQAAVDRSTATARLFSDSMAEVGAKSITNDAELLALLRSAGIKRLVIVDSQSTWRDFEIDGRVQP